MAGGEYFGGPSNGRDTARREAMNAGRAQGGIRELTHSRLATGWYQAVVGRKET
jgi:hypothetical protein